MTITTELVAFIILVFGAVSGVWWRVEGKVKGAEDKAGAVGAELSEFKLRTAETYATKAVMEAQTAQIMKAIDGVGERIEGVNLRLDRVIEQRGARTRAG